MKAEVKDSHSSTAWNSLTVCNQGEKDEKAKL